MMTKKAKPFLKELMAAPLVASGELSESASKELREKALEQLSALPNIPEETRKMLTEQLSTDPITLVGIWMAAALAIGYMTISSTLSPFFTLLNYQTSKLANQYRLDPDSVAKLWLRGFPKGQNTEEWEKLTIEEKTAETERLRDEVEKWFGELSDQGFGSHEQEAVKELAHYLPGATEIMTWAAREVFEPKLREKYQLDKFLPPDFLKWAEKVGITGEVAKNYWASHWVLPSLMNIQELWRRQIIDKEVVDDFWTELDMVPWIREDLFKLFRAVPTRVDVRRFWDMRTIDEARLRDIYKAQGYWEEDLEDYVTWTKVYVAFPDLIARYRNTWISKEELMTELYALNPEHPERMDELYETKFKPVAEERVAETTALTRSLIIKGAKEGKLSPGETIDLLMLKHYSREEAEYIYDLEVGAASSPETPMEFRQLVESYRRSQGLEFKDIPTEVLEADKKRSELRSALSQAMAAKEAEDKVARLQSDLEIAEVTLKQLKMDYGL